MNEEERLNSLLGQDLDIKSAIQVAKIVSHAPEERLPMILDIFSQAGVEISGMESVEALKEIAKKRMQIQNLENFLAGIEKLTQPLNGEYRILTEVFDSYCRQTGENTRNARRTLAEMGLIRTSTLSSGKLELSVPVYSPDTKQIARCVCMKENWRSILGVDNG